MAMRRTLLTVAVTFLAVSIEHLSGREFELGPCYLQFAETCSNNSIQFFLFSSELASDAQPLKLDKRKPMLPLGHDGIVASRVKLIIHGYGGHLDFNGSKHVRNAYLKKANTMVIVVDWSRLAKLPCYPSAAINTKQAGECTAQFLMALEKYNEGFKASKIHAVGFSLGAHVASFASNAVERMSGVKFDRITGLDPALPFFATARKHWKLDSSDGKFVDVLHTNAGFYGKMEACGHTDFYINNGQHQPACSGAKNYFAESINSNISFYGRRCESYLGFVFGWCNASRQSQRLSSNSTTTTAAEWSTVKMGEDCRQKAEGVVFVRTYRKSPYAMGQKG